MTYGILDTLVLSPNMRLATTVLFHVFRGYLLEGVFGMAPAPENRGVFGAAHI
jgi:hypothetical protein